MRVLGAVACALLATTPTLANAQAFELDRYRAAETPEDGFALSRPNDLGHLRVGVQLHLDYSNDPLVYQLVGGAASTEVASLVEHHLVGQLGFALGLADRLVLFLGMPVNLVLTGDDVPMQPLAEGTTMGDLRFGARLRLAGKSDDGFGLAVQLTATAPTAKVGRDPVFGGEGGATIHPEVVAEGRGGPIRVTFNLGTLIRRNAQLTGLEVGEELTYGLGLAALLADGVLSLHAEAYGSLGFAGLLEKNQSPLEGILGLRIHPKNGLHIGFAGGTGIQRGYGAGDMRAVLTFGWATPEPERVPEDRDGDGIVDGEDACPDEPEDDDSFEDENGCPDPDNDEDGVLDANDRCPMQAEDADSFEDEDGCPEDGPVAPEPEPEPEVEEPPPTVEAEPEDPPETSSVVFGARVYFDLESADLRRDQVNSLRTLARILRQHPEVETVRIEGHADESGDDHRNIELSLARARAVRDWLMQRGVDAGRLRIVGCGEMRTVSNGRVEHRPRDRRVELYVLVPPPVREPPHAANCHEE